MNVFALINNPAEAIPLTEDNFYRRTNRKHPYMQSVGGKMNSYALCPSCQNPVLLVNRTATETRSGSFYAKHNKGDVPEVADYKEHKYLNCPLANPARMDEKKRRPPARQGQSDEVKNALIEAFDLVMNFIESDTGIKFQDSIIEDMLNDFAKNRGYEYAAITLYNLPYAFAYMTEAKDIFGCSVDTAISDAIKNSSKGFFIKQLGHSNYIKRIEGGRSKIRLLFYGHAESVKDGGSEAIVMRIVEIPPGADADTAELIYEKKIVLDGAKFFNFYMKRKRRVELARSKLQ